MNIANPDGTIDQRKLEEYRKRSIQFTRNGMIRGFYHNPDDPQGIALGANNKNVKGFNDHDYTGNLYVQ